MTRPWSNGSFRAERPPSDGAGCRTPEEEDEVPPELARQAVHEVLDRYYRPTLDQRVPAHDGRTPHEAARTPAQRKKVVDGLKLIENRSAGQAGSPLASTISDGRG